MSEPKRKVLRPKESFQASKLASEHVEWVNSEHARVSLEAAIAELTMLMPRPETMEQACRYHYEILGARRFIDTFLNLAQPDIEGSQRPNDNLLCLPLRPQPNPSSKTRPTSRPPKA